ncbi:hypothetical protein C2E23DRAFT_898165, partial [Lenzites betulinus]
CVLPSSFAGVLRDALRIPSRTHKNLGGAAGTSPSLHPRPPHHTNEHVHPPIVSHCSFVRPVCGGSNNWKKPRSAYRWRGHRRHRRWLRSGPFPHPPLLLPCVPPPPSWEYRSNRRLRRPGQESFRLRRKRKWSRCPRGWLWQWGPTRRLERGRATRLWRRPPARWIHGASASRCPSPCTHPPNL